MRLREPRNGVLLLVDSWYATRELMLLIDGMEMTFYCPLKSNRHVDDSEASALTDE